MFRERYEAWLNYCRRAQVWSHSRGEIFVNNEPYREIIRLGIPALPFPMEKLEQVPIEGRLLHRALMVITKKKFHLRQEETDGQLLWMVEEFPDILPSRSQPDTNILWLGWSREGIGVASQQFEELYRELKSQEIQKQEDASETYRKMVDLGLVALPMMIEKVRQGEVDLISAISELTDEAVAEDTPMKECLAWWEKEGEKWTISLPKTRGQTVPKDTTAVGKVEEKP